LVKKTIDLFGARITGVQQAPVNQPEAVDGERAAREG
jgi:hypothetical protein